MASKLSADESIALIHENLNEVLKPELIEDVIMKQNRPLVVYWGTFPHHWSIYAQFNGFSSDTIYRAHCHSY